MVPRNHGPVLNSDHQWRELYSRLVFSPKTQLTTWNYNFLSGYFIIISAKGTKQKQKKCHQTRLFKVKQYPKDRLHKVTPYIPIFYMHYICILYTNQIWPSTFAGLWVPQPLHAHLGIPGGGGGFRILLVPSGCRFFNHHFLLLQRPFFFVGQTQ